MRCALLILLLAPALCFAGVGDPQLKTDHPWYPGELSCSTFDRLFATQARLYQRVTGRPVRTDEDKAIASWYWRNLHYAHGEDGKCDLFDQGFATSEWNREYWTGLFAHGFGLCGTTHAQWNAEINALLGHCRSRSVGVTGHNSFEVYLTGGAYGKGRWALLDHDISTMIFSEDGSRLLSIREIIPNVKTFSNPSFKPDRQRGWRIAGLHDDDAAGVYTSFHTAEYLAGYAGPPPIVHLRSGESLRRYLKPGLDDGTTFVFWGMNYRTAGIPGPERSRAWINQPEKLFNSSAGTGHKPGQVRYANAVYTYRPNFSDGSYRQAVVAETDSHVTFEFQSPYVIAATPPNDKSWGIYDDGARNGLIISGRSDCALSISTDRGQTWHDAGIASGNLDLTDFVKGHHQYLLRFNAPAASLTGTNLSWRTVCQCNVAIIPRLHDGTNLITFQSSGQAITSAGPNLDQAKAHMLPADSGPHSVTLELKTPRGESATRLYAASWNGSGNPPGDTAFNIDYSTDAGQTWTPVVKDWRIIRRSPEPEDFWSQSFCWGDVELAKTTAPIRVRFTNTGRKTFRKVEAHLVYEVAKPSATQVTFAWREGDGPLRKATHTYPANVARADPSWQLPTGTSVQTEWVEYAAK